MRWGWKKRDEAHWDFNEQWAVQFDGYGWFVLHNGRCRLVNWPTLERAIADAEQRMTQEQ